MRSRIQVPTTQQLETHRATTSTQDTKMHEILTRKKGILSIVFRNIEQKAVWYKVGYVW